MAQRKLSKESRLQTSARLGDVQSVVAMMRDGVSCRFVGGSTALHKAVLGDHAHVLRAILKIDEGASDLQDLDGKTALFLACEMGKVKCVRVLLEHYADPNIAAEIPPSTPLEEAARNNDTPCVEALLDHSKRLAHASVEAAVQLCTDPIVERKLKQYMKQQLSPMAKDGVEWMLQKIRQKQCERPFRQGDSKLVIDCDQPLLGSGAFGIVLRGKLNKASVAVKVPLVVRAREREQIDFKNECQLLTRLNHPNVVRLLTTFDANEDFVLGFMVMEVLQPLPDVLSPHDALVALAQVGSGVAYLHAQDIIHRDLKPSNILWDGASTYKVADLGGARICEEAGYNVASGGFGTQAYRAPEMYGPGAQYTSAVDVFSFGVCILELYRGVPMEASVLGPPMDMERNCLIEPVARYDFYFRLIRSWTESTTGARQSVVDIVTRCLALRDNDRPLMADVAGVLDQLSRAS